MDKCEFEHGGKEYDDKYPEGIPSSIVVTLKNGKTFDSKFVMFPSGHARNETANLAGILNHKFKLLGSIALNENDLNAMIEKANKIETLSNGDL